MKQSVGITYFYKLCLLCYLTHRGVYDIKATDMGVGLVRFKAEIDFDGREVTRAYLDTIDPDALLEVSNYFILVRFIKGYSMTFLDI